MPVVDIPFQLASGTVAFYQDPNRRGARSDIRINDYVLNRRYVVPDAQYDKTSYVLYHLPVGTVMTLLGGWNTGGDKMFDLSSCDTCLDLVGTGRTESCQLWDVGLNDDLSMFFWRNIDLSIGDVEVFANPNFTDARTTLFLSEWAPAAVYTLCNWRKNNVTIRIEWPTLADRQTVTLYDGEDGSGSPYSNVKGWGSTKEIPYLWEVRFNDCISSFKWESVVPVKEIIKPFTIQSANSSSAFGLTSSVDGRNKSNKPQPVVVSLNDSTAQTITVESSDQHVVGVCSTFSQIHFGGAEGIVASSTQWSVSLNYSYNRTDTKSRSETKTVDLSVMRTVNAPARTTYRATLLVTIGCLPPTEYVTIAERWYKEPVIGAQADPANKGWYKRVEDVRINVGGSLACRTTVDMQATPLPPESTWAWDGLSELFVCENWSFRIIFPPIPSCPSPDPPLISCFLFLWGGRAVKMINLKRMPSSVI